MDRLVATLTIALTFLIAAVLEDGVWCTFLPGNEGYGKP